MHDVTQTKIIHFQSNHEDDLHHFLHDNVLREYYTNEDVQIFLMII